MPDDTPASDRDSGLGIRGRQCRRQGCERRQGTSRLLPLREHKEAQNHENKGKCEKTELPTPLLRCRRIVRLTPLARTSNRQ